MWPKGTKHSEEHKRKIRESCKGKINLGSQNGMWKDSPKYKALHLWVRDHLGKNKVCQECGQKKPVDLANITGIYNRELCNWLWLCRKCHMEMDGRLYTNLKQFAKK